MINDNQPCPSFPHFGARYPDACCIDGYLWDLDKCNDDGTLYGGGDDPCPFCNTEAYIEFHLNEESGVTRETVLSHIEKLRERYGK